MVIVLFTNPHETSTRAQRLWGPVHFLLAGGAVTCEPLTVANTCPLTKRRGQSGAQSVGTVLLSLVGAPEGMALSSVKALLRFWGFPSAAEHDQQEQGSYAPSPGFIHGFN